MTESNNGFYNNYRGASSMKRNILVLSVIIFPLFALASEQIYFNSASVPPTPFKIKQAKAKGIELKPKPGVALVGQLSKPKGTGSFPAVILLHSCFGIRPYQDRWAMKLTQWGYVALQVDSFGPRNMEDTCTDLDAAFWLGVGTTNFADVHGALLYLRGQPFVDKDRVAVMGWGHSAILSAVLRNGEQRYSDGKFSAAIALYPDCRELSSGDFYVPLLLHIGVNDDWNLPKFCERMAAASEPLPNPIELRIHPDTQHGFDDADVGQRWYYEKAQNRYKTPARGATLGYNAVAHQSAEEHVRAFLTMHLK